MIWYGVIIMYLRISFLLLLCVPVLYVFFILFNQLIDELVYKDRKSDDHKNYDYQQDYIFQEYKVNKRREDFKVIR